MFCITHDKQKQSGLWAALLFNENFSKDECSHFDSYSWYLTMGVLTVLALLPIEDLQMPILNWWDKPQHVLALTVWALFLWPNAAMNMVLGMLAYGASIVLLLIWPNGHGWRFAVWADLAVDAFGVRLIQRPERDANKS